MDQRWFQLMLYKIIVERSPTLMTTGKSVDEVELIYLKDGKSVSRKMKDGDDERTLARVVKVHGEIQKAVSTGEFPTKVSRLCDWCHYKRICPAWANRRNW